MPQSLIRVSPSETNPTHDISLTDGQGGHYGLSIQGGLANLQALPQTASTLRFTGGNGKFGDYEPSLSHIEQRTWQGGRGGEYYSDDPTKYFDAHHMWTLSPNIMMPAGEPIWARGLRNQDDHSRAKITSSTDVKHFFWKSLISSNRGWATKFVASASYDADACYIYIRRTGTPGTLTFRLYSHTADVPNAVLQSATVTTATITDLEGVFYKFDWSGTQALVSGTSYWVAVVGASTDNIDNHWDVGVSQTIDRISGSNDVASSTDASAWSGATTGQNLYFRVVDADVKRTFLYFTLDGGLYAVDKRADSSNSHLYLAGTRGKATAATSTSITDTNNTDTVYPIGDNNYVYIIRGTGYGQARTITAGTAPSTGLTVSPAWDTTPSTDSEYIIFGQNLWKEITGHGLGIVKEVVVCNNIAYFAQGPSDNIRRIRWNPAAGPPAAHEFADDSTNTADHLALCYKDTKPVIWRGVDSTSAVSRADGVTWGTDLTFGTAIPVGDTTWPISSMIEYDDGLVVGKPDNVWLETADDKFERLPVDIDRIASPNNCRTMLAKDLFLYFSFAYSVEKYYSGTLSDVGPWRGPGLPDDRKGFVSKLESGVGLIFYAIDGGTDNYSSVLATDGIGFCEIFRAPMAGERIQSMAWQPAFGQFNRLWVECNGSMWAIPFPKRSLNPQYELAYPFTHECSLISSTFDMDSATLPKYFKELQLATRNLFESTDGSNPSDIYIGEIEIDYQADSNIGTSTWTNLTQILRSPFDTAALDLGEVRAIRFRYRIYASYQAGVGGTLVPWIAGTVLGGYSRTPIKYQYIFRAEVGTQAIDKTGAPDASVEELYAWLLDAAVSARKIRMRSRWKFMDDKIVVVEPPAVLPSGSGVSAIPGQLYTAWNGVLSLILREV